MKSELARIHPSIYMMTTLASLFESLSISRRPSDGTTSFVAALLHHGRMLKSNTTASIINSIATSPVRSITQAPHLWSDLSKLPFASSLVSGPSATPSYMILSPEQSMKKPSPLSVESTSTTTTTLPPTTCSSLISFPHTNLMISLLMQQPHGCQPYARQFERVIKRRPINSSPEIPTTPLINTSVLLVHPPLARALDRCRPPDSVAGFANYYSSHNLHIY